MEKRKWKMVSTTAICGIVNTSTSIGIIQPMPLRKFGEYGSWVRVRVWGMKGICGCRCAFQSWIPKFTIWWLAAVVHTNLPFSFTFILICHYRIMSSSVSKTEMRIFSFTESYTNYFHYIVNIMKKRVALILRYSIGLLGHFTKHTTFPCNLFIFQATVIFRFCFTFNWIKPCWTLFKSVLL